MRKAAGNDSGGEGEGACIGASAARERSPDVESASRRSEPSPPSSALLQGLQPDASSGAMSVEAGLRVARRPAPHRPVAATRHPAHRGCAGHHARRDAARARSARDPEPLDADRSVPSGARARRRNSRDRGARGLQRAGRARSGIGAHWRMHALRRHRPVAFQAARRRAAPGITTG
jgi:hypothetical protein